MDKAKNCKNCEYWLKSYDQCEHPEQRQEECGEYMAPPEKTCELWLLHKIDTQAMTIKN